MPTSGTKPDRSAWPAQGEGIIASGGVRCAADTFKEDQLEAWLFDASATEDILHSAPALLEREMPYEQMSLF